MVAAGTMVADSVEMWLLVGHHCCKAIMETKTTLSWSVCLIMARCSTGGGITIKAWSGKLAHLSEMG